jgi:hypothetical protein
MSPTRLQCGHCPRLEGGLRPEQMRTRPGIVITLLSGDAKGILLAARAAQEIGADFVKTSCTGDPESFHKVVEGCPVPGVVLGGEKAETIEQVFSLPEWPVHVQPEIGTRQASSYTIQFSGERFTVPPLNAMMPLPS